MAQANEVLAEFLHEHLKRRLNEASIGLRVYAPQYSLWLQFDDASVAR